MAGDAPLEANDSNALFPALRLGLPDGRIRRSIALTSAAITAYKRGKALWEREQAKRNWTLGLEDTDDLYPAVHSWLLRQMPDEERRHLRAVTHRGNATLGVAVFSSSDPVPADEPDEPAPRLVSWMFDSSRTATVILDGQVLQVGIETKDRNQASSRDDDYRRYREPDTIRFTARNQAGFEAAQRFLENLAAETFVSMKREPRLRIAARWGDWQHRNDLPRRELDTIVLNTAEQKRAIVEDLAGFFEAEERYNRLGAPWHRGYLFWGPPGTGKTSLARALATHFGLDLYYIPLRDMNADADLLSLVSSVPSRSVLLLEDVDASSMVTHDRDEVEQAATGDGPRGISLSGLLNSLDGVATPHGLIVMMTSNRPDVLDPALLRPGRVDVQLEVGLLTYEQLRGLWAIAYPGIPTGSLITPAEGVTPAQALEVFHRHPDHPEAAASALNTLCATRVPTEVPS